MVSLFLVRGADTHLVYSADLIHAKVDGAGELVPSGGPSCWQCSRSILAAGIPRIWLYHEAGTIAPGMETLSRGWHCYAALEFHRLTLQNCDLPYRLPPEAR